MKYYPKSYTREKSLHIISTCMFSGAVHDTDAWGVPMCPTQEKRNFHVWLSTREMCEGFLMGVHLSMILQVQITLFQPLHPWSTVDATVDDSQGSEVCRKNIGEPKRLRRWSRGHQFVV